MLVSFLFYALINTPPGRILCMLGGCVSLVFIVMGLWWSIGCYTNKTNIPNSIPSLRIARKTICAWFGLLVFCDFATIGLLIIYNGLSDTLGMLAITAFAIIPIGIVRLLSLGAFIFAFSMVKNAENSLIYVHKQLETSQQNLNR